MVKQNSAWIITDVGGSPVRYEWVSGWRVIIVTEHMNAESYSGCYHHHVHTFESSHWVSAEEIYVTSLNIMTKLWWIISSVEGAQELYWSAMSNESPYQCVWHSSSVTLTIDWTGHYSWWRHTHTTSPWVSPSLLNHYYQFTIISHHWWVY